LGETTVAKILVVDDEPRIVSFVSRALTAKGFTVAGATDGERGLELARTGRYDLVVLDLMLPGLDGVSVLREIVASRPEQPVLVLSAMRDVTTRVRCLELGAVDYLAKPFALSELVARIRTRLRATGRAPERPEPPANGEGVLRSDGLVLDIAARTADRGRGPVVLAERELLLLQHLMEHRHEVCSRPQLLAEVWGYSFDPGTNVVDVYIRRLRKKLGRDAVETVRNVGYRLGVRNRGAASVA
jgi:DNA-binding response OmpR family regulator